MIFKAITQLTYGVENAADKGSVPFYRNMLDYRNVKGNVKNEYRAYKMLYYAVLEAITLCMFLNRVGIDTIPDNSENFPKVPFPDDFTGMTNSGKLEWLNGVCTCIVKKKMVF